MIPAVMKKILLVLAVLAVVVVAALFFIGSNLDGIVKKAVETAGPPITQTTLTLDSVSLSPRTGSGALKGLTLGNPAGYTSPYAIKLGEARLEVDPASVLTDKIHVRSIAVTGPQITIEGGLGNNNLKQIMANIDRFTAGEKSAPAGDTGTKKKLQVDDFLLTGAQVEVKFALLGGKGLSVALPDIHLTHLGSGGDGLTPGELSKKVFSAVFEQIIPAVTAQVGKLGGLGKGLVKGALDNAKGAMDKATGGLGDLFKKK